MPPPLNVRVGIMTYEFDQWPKLLERWRWLEDLGVQSLWMGDHLWSRSDPAGGRPRMDPWIALASMASVTTKARLGTLVSSTNYRNPAVVAKQAITLDHLSNGRVDLGIGAGSNPLDEASAGLGPVTTGSRRARFEESARVIAELLSSEVTTQVGPLFKFDQVVSLPRAVQQPRLPLLIAAHSEASLKIAAELGDGWCSFGGGASLGRVATPIPAQVALTLTRQRSELLDSYAQSFGRGTEPKRRLLLGGFTDDRPWDSPESFTDFLSRYAAVGINEFAFPFPTPGLDRATLERVLSPWF